MISTALKAGSAPVDVVEAAVNQMTRLNAEASRVALAHGSRDRRHRRHRVRLIGHLGRAARESGVDVDLSVGSVPFIDGVRAPSADAGFVPGGSTQSGLADRPGRRPRSATPRSTVPLLVDAHDLGRSRPGSTRDHVDDVLAQLARPATPPLRSAAPRIPTTPPTPACSTCSHDPPPHRDLRSMGRRLDPNTPMSTPSTSGISKWPCRSTRPHRIVAAHGEQGWPQFVVVVECST
ncbi:MAG: hypothetical protein R2710_16110 [Acidimicrobiales bacterium]